MNRPRLVAMAIVLTAASASAAPRPYVLPPETAELAEGPHVDLADAACSSCHSVDYITTQPPQHSDPKAFWAAEVTKMQKAYGASLKDEDKALIVQYLAETYR